MKQSPVENIERSVLNRVFRHTSQFLRIASLDLDKMSHDQVVKKFVRAVIAMNSKQMYEYKDELLTKDRICRGFEGRSKGEIELAIHRLVSKGQIYPINIEGALDNIDSYILTFNGLSSIIYGKPSDFEILSILFDMQVVDKIRSLERFIRKGISVRDSMLLVVVLFFGFDEENPLRLQEKGSGQILQTILNELHKTVLENDEELFDIRRDFGTTPYYRNLRELRYKISKFFYQEKKKGRITCYMETHGEVLSREDIMKFIVEKIYDRIIREPIDREGSIKRLMRIDHILERILDKRYPPRKEFRIRHTLMFLNVRDVEDKSWYWKKAAKIFLKVGRARLKSLKETK